MFSVKFCAKVQVFNFLSTKSLRALICSLEPPPSASPQAPTAASRSSRSDFFTPVKTTASSVAASASASVKSSPASESELRAASSSSSATAAISSTSTKSTSPFSVKQSKIDGSLVSNAPFSASYTQQIDDALVDAMIDAGWPLLTTSIEAVGRLFHLLSNGRYRVLKRTAMTAKVDERYRKMRDKVMSFIFIEIRTCILKFILIFVFVFHLYQLRDKLAKAQSVSVTADGATVCTTQQYVAVTGHWIERQKINDTQELWTLCRALLSLKGDASTPSSFRFYCLIGATLLFVICVVCQHRTRPIALLKSSENAST